MFAVGVRLLFRHEVAVAAAVLRRRAARRPPISFEGAGLTHSTGTGRGVLEISALFALVDRSRSRRAGRAPSGDEPVVDIDPANRLRVLCILTSVAMCSAIPLADAWSSGHRDVSTLVPGACAIVMFVLIALRLWHLAAGARAAGMRHGLRRLGALVQGLNDAIFVVDRAGVISYASPRASAILGIDGRRAGRAAVRRIPRERRSRIGSPASCRAAVADAARDARGARRRVRRRRRARRATSR